MIGYIILTTLVPHLDTRTFESKWAAYWRRGISRRLVPAAMASLMVFGAVPVQAAGTPTFDYAGWVQRAERYIQANAKWAWDIGKSVEGYARQGILAYHAYNQARNLVTRLSGAQITVSIADALPMIEIDSSFEGGTQETLTMRPVFRERDRVGKFRSPRVRIDNVDWRNLDFDIDRSVAHTKDPNEGKSPDQLRQQALDDGYLSWQRAQQIHKIPTTVTEGNYQAGSEMSDYYRRRMGTLRDTLRRAITTYGEDSVQYRAALDKYTDWVQAMADGRPDEEAKALEADLKAIDGEAQRAVETYATNNLMMTMAHQRAKAAGKNVQEISAKYDSNSSNRGLNLTQFISILGGLKDLADTVNALGGYKPDKTNPKVTPPETLGNAMKQTTIARWQADTSDQALKLQARKAQEEAQSAMLRAAERKAARLAAHQAQQDALDAADQAEILRAKADQILKNMNVQTICLMLPEGVTPIVPETALDAVPGAVGPANAQDAIKKNITTLGTKATKNLGASVDKAITETGSKVSWGVLQPVAKALEAGLRSLGIKSFDLTSAVPSEEVSNG